jgi:hypothetical protein
MSATKMKELGSSFTSTAVLAVGSCANSHIVIIIIIIIICSRLHHTAQRNQFSAFCSVPRFCKP